MSSIQPTSDLLRSILASAIQMLSIQLVLQSEIRMSKIKQQSIQCEHSDNYLLFFTYLNDQRKLNTAEAT